MKRRDFNRLVVGAGITPIFAKSSFAQMSPDELQEHACEGGCTKHHHQEFSANL